MCLSYEYMKIPPLKVLQQKHFAQGEIKTIAGRGVGGHGLVNPKEEIKKPERLIFLNGGGFGSVPLPKQTRKISDTK